MVPDSYVWMLSMCKVEGIDQVLHTLEKFVMRFRAGNEVTNEYCSDLELGSDSDDDGEGLVGA